LEGRLGNRIRTIRDDLVALLAQIEASIDFPDEGLGPDDRQRLRGRLDKVREEIAKDHLLRNPKDTSQVFITGTGDVLCYDMLTGRYFLSSAEKIRKAENRVNRELNNFMYASLTLFYDEVGLPPTTYTDTVGWQGNENLEVNITTVLSDDEKPCLALDFSPLPTSEYTKRLYD
jgi:hypothetical protein